MDPLSEEMEDSNADSEQTDLFPDVPDVEIPVQPDSDGSSTLCFFCYDGVDEDDINAYHEVSSWVRGPKKDSATLRKYTGRRAHGECVSRIAAGLAPRQKSLEETVDSTPSAPEEFVSPFHDSIEYSDGYRQGYKGLEKLGDHLDYLQGYATGVAHRKAAQYRAEA